MEAGSKARLSRIAGNLSVILAVIVALVSIATPDYGPAPSTHFIIFVVLFAAFPLFVFGIWLRHLARRSAETTEMQTYIEELDNEDPNKAQQETSDSAPSAESEAHEGRRSEQ